MTDAELDAIEQWAREDRGGHAKPCRPEDYRADDVLALVAEVRRYRATFGVYEKPSTLREWLGRNATSEPSTERTR